MYFLCSMYCLACNVPCIVCVYMCTEQLPPGGYPIAVKYIISYHQELSNCSSSLWFYLRIVVIVVLCSWSVRTRTKHDYHHDTKVKPEAATAVIELLMMDGRTPETCWVVNKHQDNKLENFCIWLVIYLNFTMMHGLTNLKFKSYEVCCVMLLVFTPPFKAIK